LVSSIEAYVSALMSKWRQRYSMQAPGSRHPIEKLERSEGLKILLADMMGTLTVGTTAKPFPASIPWRTRGLYGTFKEE
jgi:hypothetical protein